MTDPVENHQEVLAELHDIDETLARLRADSAPQAKDVGDLADDAASATAYEEAQALIENLEQRRRTLAAKLEGQ
jgi:DNA-directed RNA polymerase specialized sigma54-like protein